ncbi:uncharacterized protein BKA55DRAFT_583899 [Fusarium redolens]|uniref:Uncharacterized protein n=1 Tax=Fusarium redolens TaxID=48865 RepID=A0A9P9JUV9_FUSRE|nr:uncharacterized protein BKA55DRAFT_583899 [Fusarium redolens]KAH7228551.1 hypothetical protein BKA55DRAFT_583899 [Fusarium redolens]
MESSQPRPSQAYIRSRRPVLAPQAAQRIAGRAIRCRPKRTALKAPQDVRSSSLGSYRRPVDNIRQSRMMPVRDRMYDRQPQLVATPEDEEDDEMDYHDEEPCYDEEFGDPQDPQDDDRYVLEALISQQSKATLTLINKMRTEFLENMKQMRTESSGNMKQMRTESSESMKQMRKEFLEALKQIRTDNNQLPQRISETIVRTISGQTNLHAQGATGRGAPFQMGLDSTVDPSNLMSNTGGTENNGS